MDNADTQYRALTVHAPPINRFTGGMASPQLVGVFDPAKVRAFDPLSEVPLSIYQPVAATPADAASSTALHGSALLPNQNLGGLVSQPVNLITTLSALKALQNSGYYGNKVHKSDPISVIRVRVAGVTGPDSVSLERVREVAQQIALRTHLSVDIVDGSSPKPTTIDVPAGKFGQPALNVTEPWVKKGVAVSILRAIDRASALLFVLILVVCMLFVANSATAAVRARRREFGVLACLGWTRPRVFASVLGELTVLGVVAGLLSAAVALPLGAALGVTTAPGRTLLAVPVAVGVALVAGAVPAGLASRAAPLNAIRPPARAARRQHRPRGITSLAVSNVTRVPGRTVTAAISLAVGIAALTLLTSISVAFHGAAVGTLLGNAVTLQVRGVDYVAVGTTVALGLLSVADSVYLNITERAAELATIRALGWPEATLSRLVITEGIVMGLAGALAGAGVGLAVAAQLGGEIPGEVIAVAIVATLAGTAITALAALLPAQALRRLPTAQLLAEE
jgi:putative ABC transport system permease protein